jgi:hypothetical protein
MATTAELNQSTLAENTVGVPPTVLTLILGIASLGFVRYRRLIDSFAVKLSVVCKAWI